MHALFFSVPPSRRHFYLIRSDTYVLRRMYSEHVVFSLSDTAGVELPGIVFEFTCVTFSWQILFGKAPPHSATVSFRDISVSRSSSIFYNRKAFRCHPCNLNTLARIGCARVRGR